MRPVYPQVAGASRIVPRFRAASGTGAENHR